MASEKRVFSEQEVEEIAEVAATKALGRLLLALDVNVHELESVRRLRDNLNYLETKRQGEDDLKATIKRGCLYGMGVALMGFLYLIKDILHDGFISVIIGK